MYKVEYQDYNGDSGASPAVFATLDSDAKTILDDDFNSSVGSAGATSLAGYTVAEETNGATGSGQLDDANEAGGVIVLQGDTADDCGITIRTNECVSLTEGKKLAGEVRVKLSDADGMDFFFGLCTASADPCGTVPNDVICLRVVDGDASIKYRVDKNGAVGADTDSGEDAVDDTFVKLGFLVDGTSSVQFYVDGEKVGSAIESNLPDDEVLCVQVGMLTGSAATFKASVDRITVKQDA